MGPYAVATQFQQRPAPRAGGMIKVERLPVAADWPRHAATLRIGDLAATAEGAGADPVYTVGVRMAEQDGRCWVVDVVRGRWSAAEVEAVVAETARRDGPLTRVHL